MIWSRRLASMADLLPRVQIPHLSRSAMRGIGRMARVLSRSYLQSLFIRSADPGDSGMPNIFIVRPKVKIRIRSGRRPGGTHGVWICL